MLAGVRIPEAISKALSLGQSVRCRAMKDFQETYTGVKCFVYKFTWIFLGF
jgi:hypothetical protein